MVGPMTRRVRRTIVSLIAAAQLLAVLPSFGSDIACADGAMGTSTEQHCPCCPEGVATTADCLTACISGAAATSSNAILSAASTRLDAPEAEQPVVSGLTDPPLNPPPIH